MPTFEFNRLVRGKLPEVYAEMGQKATYKELSQTELLEALREKVIEELREVPLGADASAEEQEGELADVEQAWIDFKTTVGILQDRIESIRQEKLQKKGSFLDGRYVIELELSDDDEWVDYYRRDPERYPEADSKK